MQLVCSYMRLPVSFPLSLSSLFLSLPPYSLLLSPSSSLPFSLFSLSTSLSPPLQLCRTHHYTSRDMFWEHVNLIVNNCITYNGNILVAIHCGCGLWVWFEWSCDSHVMSQQVLDAYNCM